MNKPDTSTALLDISIFVVMANREERVDGIAHDDRALEEKAGQMVLKPHEENFIYVKP